VKGIGAFVLVLLVALGVVMYVVTRPPDRVLDAQGEAWVDEFQGWRSAKERTVDRAIVGLTFTSQKKNARGLEPLRTCTASLRRIGTPPELLAPVEDAALDRLDEVSAPPLLYPYWWQAKYDERLGEADLASLGRYRAVEPEDGLHRSLPGFDVIPGGGASSAPEGGGRSTT